MHQYISIPVNFISFGYQGAYEYANSSYFITIDLFASNLIIIPSSNLTKPQPVQTTSIERVYVWTQSNNWTFHYTIRFVK